MCGDPNFGVTRFSCCACNIELAVPFSCKTRICPSCAKRRAEEVAANLVERLPAVGHRHLVVTIPRKAGLRLRILEDPKLFRKLAQIIVRVLRRQMVRQLLALVWRVDPLECPRCGEQMERGRTMRGEELREFLKSINRLGYPPRPPPVPPGGRGWPQESLADPFIEPDSTQFIDDTSQVLPDWES